MNLAEFQPEFITLGSKSFYHDNNGTLDLLNTSFSGEIASAVFSIPVSYRAQNFSYTEDSGEKIDLVISIVEGSSTIDNYGPEGDDRQGAIAIHRYFASEQRLEPVALIP